MAMNDYTVEASGYSYRLQGGPLDNPNSAATALAAIGLVAASWARMEQHIDLILIQINKAEHSDEIVDLYTPYHPGTFDKKVKLLKQYFNRHPALAALKDPAIDAATGLKRIAEDRNILIHGILESFDLTTQEITINVTKFHPKTDDFSSRIAVWPIRRLEAHAEVVNRAHNQLCQVSRQLFRPDTASLLQRSKLPTRPWWRRLLGL